MCIVYYCFESEPAFLQLILRILCYYDVYYRNFQLLFSKCNCKSLELGLFGMLIELAQSELLLKLLYKY